MRHLARGRRARGVPGEIARRRLDRVHAASAVPGPLGAELDGTRSDKSHLLAYALKETATDPSKTLMIGDRSHDMIGARNNGMTAIGVLYGYGSQEELVDAGAHHICATPDKLIEHTGTRSAHTGD